MGRLSIEISEHQHQQIKAMAALQGISIKDYILQTALPPTLSEAEPQSDAQALAQLKALLAPRLDAAERGEYSDRTMDEIIQEARSRREPG